jgi:hypothetical protein
LTEAGAHWRITLFTGGRQPARVTRSSAWSAEDRQRRPVYFFFRRLVFFAVFFTAAFVFLFFAIAALLSLQWMATLEQCSRESICTAIRITPKAKKEQSFRLILCIAAAALGATACGALSLRQCSGAKIVLDKICCGKSPTAQKCR